MHQHLRRQGELYRFDLSDELAARVRAFNAERGLTLFMTMTARRRGAAKKVYAAPRRLAVLLTALETQQPDRSINLDGEAANLIVYQQYYQACAKVIEVGTSLLDTNLDIN